MTPRKEDIDLLALQFRTHIRAKAGLETAWVDTNESMRDWYRMLARRSLEAEGVV